MVLMNARSLVCDQYSCCLLPSYPDPEKIREGVTREMLDRNPPRFADLVGVNNFLGFDRSGPDFSKGSHSRVDLIDFFFA